MNFTGGIINSEVHLKKYMVAQLIYNGSWPIKVGVWEDGTPKMVTLIMVNDEEKSVAINDKAQ